MADIFISYASEDRSRVEQLAKALKDQGWSVFWDFTIPVGKTWRQVITEALDDAKCAVVVWSSSSINSDWVHEEAEEAQERRILVPTMIDKVKPPLGFRRMQAARLMKWAGEPNHPEFVKLRKAIKGILGSSPLKAKEEEQKPIEATRKAKEERKKKGAIGERESKPEKTISNNIGMKFQLIPSGKFMIGSPPDEPERYDDEMQHEVIISKPFYLQTTEVSQGQWEKVMDNNPSSFKKCGKDCPVEKVSWDDAQKFISKLNQMEGTNKYRLPTEAEWEYACRAGTETAYSFGDDVKKLGEYAWYGDNSENRTHPGGKKKPNAWGLYDMHGNVLEWVQDWYGDYPSTSVVDPKGPTKGEYRVLRGGSWFSLAWNLRSARRGWDGPDNRGGRIGFRVARDF